MKIYFLIIQLFFLFGFTRAQVGIGLEDNLSPKATIHLGKIPSTSSLGIKAPQLKLSEILIKNNSYTTALEGTLVYVSAIDGVQNLETQKITKEGYYFFDGVMWNGFSKEEYFHLPFFIQIDNQLISGKELDIYEEVYLKQFSKEPVNQFLSNNSSLPFVGILYTREQLDFVITYFDDKVMKVNSISPEGILNYDIISTDYSLDSFINIVLVVKDN